MPPKQKVEQPQTDKKGRPIVPASQKQAGQQSALDKAAAAKEPARPVNLSQKQQRQQSALDQANRAREAAKGAASGGFGFGSKVDPRQYGTDEHKKYPKGSAMYELTSFFTTVLSDADKITEEKRARRNPELVAQEKAYREAWEREQAKKNPGRQQPEDTQTGPGPQGSSGQESDAQQPSDKTNKLNSAQAENSGPRAGKEPPQESKKTKINFPLEEWKDQAVGTLRDIFSLNACRQCRGKPPPDSQDTEPMPSNAAALAGPQQTDGLGDDFDDDSDDDDDDYFSRR